MPSETKDPFRISGKDLGVLAMPDYCPRCFWIRRKVSQLPFQIFPGIFSSIDSYTKNVVHGWFDRHNGPPHWLAPIEGIVRYQPPLHYSKFWIRHEPTGVRLTGAVDALFELSDGTLCIADYKTARYKEENDGLLPIYRTQLNAYAMIAEGIGLGRVTRLALIYADPCTGEDVTCKDEIHAPDGFSLGFAIKILPIPLNREAIPILLAKAREIMELQQPPLAAEGCKDCPRLAVLVQAVMKGSPA